MSLPTPLAGKTDAIAYGYSLPVDSADALLARASARIRRAAGQPITPSTVIVQLTVAGGVVELPAPPVLEVQAVSSVGEDGTLTTVTGWWWDGEHLRFPTCLVPRAQVTYRRGWDPVPDGIVELTCSVADRLSGTPKGMESGIRQETVDDYSVTYASEAIQYAGDLLPGELAALQRELGERCVWVVSGP
ncbi:hypothetical protein ACFZDK_24675 [Streptomyces sp. NPDC007901]|uniref:hypothetical protein n=1 Tax=Streptomyces sp. NPDC007901 TaxID=3364785 RepID=UPI0036EB59B5